MILLVDNYDSFTYNIYQYLRKMNFEVEVRRNDQIEIEEITRMNPSHIIISPGPGRPEKAGLSVEIIKQFKGKIPILGICLGHQCLGYAFGAQVVQARSLYHGKQSQITHDGREIFNNLKNPFTVVRYHSLAVKKISLPEELEVSAVSDDDEIMGIRHKRYCLEGIQFHPESIASECGFELLANFLTQKPDSPLIKTAIKRIVAGKELSEEEASKVMREIISGEATPAQVASLLTGLSLKGESVAELTGLARVMRQSALLLKKPAGVKVVDTCGTGGDGSQTFNISTLSALIVAATGVPVAKHGNRSITSRCGSADVLEAVGVNISASPERMAEALEKIGIAFLFAPRFHQSMKHAVPVRLEIGIRTVFNILGPLANPAFSDYQIIGVFSDSILEKVARVLVNLGVERAMVVHGSDGMDEITLTGKTRVLEVNNGWIKTYSFDPKEYGFPYCSLDELKGGELKTNCEIFLSVLNGEKGPRRDVVVLNAAAAIYLSGKVTDIKQAIVLAQKAIDTGSAMKKLDDLIQFTNH